MYSPSSLVLFLNSRFPIFVITMNNQRSVLFACVFMCLNDHISIILIVHFFDDVRRGDFNNGEWYEY